MKKKACWIVGCVVICALVISIAVHTRVNSTLEFDENAQNFIQRFTYFEDGENLFLNDFVPFEWDYLYIFGAYMPTVTKQERMGIDERYLLSDPHGTTFYIYFLFENEMVARMFNVNENNVISVDFSLIRDELTPEFEVIVATPDDNLEFLFELRHLVDDREIKILHLIYD